MKLQYYGLLIGLLAITQTKAQKRTVKPPAFYKEAHRGGRGLMPENTIAAMLNGIKNGANVCELDTYTSGDGLVIVSHDPTVNGTHSLNADGSEISKADSAKSIFHQMKYADIRKFDTGSKPYSAFPRQQKLKTHIPLLADLIDSVEQYTKAKHIAPVYYNIELKTSVKNDNVYNDTPQKLADAVMSVIKKKGIANRVHIQSFDIRALQYMKKAYPNVVLSFLVMNNLSIAENIKQLGFYPAIYSPINKLVTADLITYCNHNNMKIIPWTVNEGDELLRFINMGVDGVITDYPDLFKLMGYNEK
jgi:glycerophosphoryl diester phosphodiesterase